MRLVSSARRKARLSPTETVGCSRSPRGTEDPFACCSYNWDQAADHARATPAPVHAAHTNRGSEAQRLERKEEGLRAGPAARLASLQALWLECGEKRDQARRQGAFASGREAAQAKELKLTGSPQFSFAGPPLGRGLRELSARRLRGKTGRVDGLSRRWTPSAASGGRGLLDGWRAPLGLRRPRAPVLVVMLVIWSGVAQPPPATSRMHCRGDAFAGRPPPPSLPNAPLTDWWVDRSAGLHVRLDIAPRVCKRSERCE